ncbi:polysaccharide deacetylase family protein [Haloterrigena alkaliphila]|uniref:Polysaccharide deacetylase family protein n=1 Tax=Haloterrigena alkaliphila TaxID=2816475 RepID=A0A8A2VH39_9EURY|nr:polysaccharide deacetylase family protein [Haloterrigena alkaliphila]QSX00832.1 polysaccharide deacetylase family protein [Haloterrigena alkaliphila]
MKRRAYLTTAAAVTFAGCSALSDSETAEDDGNGNGDDSGNGGNGSSEPVDEEPGSFDDFEDLSNWTVMAGSLSPDEDRAYVGSQSGRMEVGADDDRAMIKREFDSPRDLSTEFPAFAFTSDSDVAPVVQLWDENEDHVMLQCRIEPDQPFAPYDLGLIDIVGEPDMSSIVHAKISVWAPNSEPTLWVDDFQFVGRPDTGTVMLQFPDETIALDAAERLAEHDLPATTFVSTDYVGSSGRPSLEELETLQDEGWTIASSGARGRDLTQLDADAQEAEISGAVDWLTEHGFDAGAFSYPLNNYDETSIDLVEEYHDIGFVAGYTGHGNVTNPQIVPRNTNPSADEADKLIEWTAELGTITTLSFRTLESLEEALPEVLDFADELEFVTPADVASDYRHE